MAPATKRNRTDQAWRARTGFDNIHSLSPVVDKPREIKEPGYYGRHPRKVTMLAGVRFETFGSLTDRGRIG